jgi:tetratricopeptide (TPR) repeat protein
MLDCGDFDEAARYLQAAIEMPELNPEAALDLVFQLGLALEAGGRLEEASEQFERIYSEEPSYPDVAQKIRALRKALEKD